MEMIKKYKRYSLLMTSALISVGCANQNNIAQSELEPVSNACQKIELLSKAYQTNFDQLKETKVSARASNIWQAKYHLIGKNCRIWTWGVNQTTYSCNTIEVDEADAKKYFTEATQTVKQCLGSAWTLTENKRSHDEGYKAEFSSPDTKMTISTHIVPSSGIFSTKWSIYYYIGNMQSTI